MSNLKRIEELQNILKKDKKNFQVRREFALLLLDCNYSEEALQQFLYLSNVFPNESGIFYNLGITYEKLKDLSRAQAAYSRAIELAPEELDAYYNLGLVYIERQKYEKAIECFEKVLEKDNEDSNAYFSIGLCYFKENKLDGAKYYFNRAASINDSDIYAHFYLANIYREQKDFDNSREELYKVLDISPDYSWAYFNLASMDYEVGFLEGAYDNLEKTLKYNPKDIDAYKIYIKILSKNNDFKKALQIASSAIENCQEEGDLYYILAQIQKELSIKDGYVKNMTEALKHSNTLSISPKTIKKEMDNFLNNN